MKYTFDHVHLVSKDPTKTAEFYEKTFGFKLDKQNSFTLPDGRKLVSLNMGGPALKISNPRPKSLTSSKESLEHFGLVVEDLEKALAEMRKNGVNVAQDITQVNPKMRVAFVVTPESVIIELMEVKG